MKTNRQTKILLNDFFGSSKDYHAYAVRFDHSLISLSLQVYNSIRCDFSYLGEYTPASSPENAKFKMMYAIVKESVNIHFVIFENKTTQFDNSLFKRKSEERFVTPSLFEDYLYALNSQGKSIHRWNYPDVDFLFLIYSEKGQHLVDFTNKIMQLKNLRLFQTPEILTMHQSKPEQKRFHFVQDLFCDTEIRISEHEKSKNDLLLPNRKMFNEYLLASRKPNDENNLVEKRVRDLSNIINNIHHINTLNLDYIGFLKDDPTFG